MKQIKNVMIALLIVAMFAGLGSAAVVVSGLANVSTSDQTPTFSFTATGTNASYACNLYVGGVASGYILATNATSASITCNQTLTSGSTTAYYVSAYNATEVPATGNSTTYYVSISTFGGLVTLLSDVVGVFSPIVDLVIAAGTVMIAIAMIAFIMGIIMGLFSFVNGGLGKMGK